MTEPLLKKNYSIFCRLACFIILLFPLTANSQILAWDFNGATTTGSVNAATNNTNLNISSISRGSGLTAGSLTNAYSSAGFTTAATLAEAITQGDYLQFTISPKVKVSLSSLEANFRRSGQGPTKLQWQYSLNDFQSAGTNFGSEISLLTAVADGEAMPSINLSGIAALQNVSSPSVITLRLYGYASSSDAAGTFALGRPTTPANDLAIFGTVTTVLPVNLISFDAKALGSTVVLNWVTASEETNKLFTVERAADNHDFSTVAEVKGAGNTSDKRTYSYTDYSAIENQEYYYRLRQTDFDGEITRSDTKTVKIKGSMVKDFSVYPNPALKTITLSYPGGSGLSLKLSSLNGELLINNTGSIQSLNQQVNEIFPGLSAGIYILQLTDGVETFSKKVVKQ